MANGWTPERRARQAELIRQWRPWEKSTGPTTETGKVIASRNGWKGGERALMRQLSHFLRGQDRERRRLLENPPNKDQGQELL